MPLHTSAPTLPRQGGGTFRVSDGGPVLWADAMALWVPLAHQELVRTASRYNEVITYGELAKQVQSHSGVHTRKLLPNWIGDLLERVAQLAADRGEPPLTALCVHQDGTIGEGYARAPKGSAGTPGLEDEDIEVYAAGHRLLCYRRYAADLPADGGAPTLTPGEVARRRKAQAPALAPVCPVHHLQLPVSGICGLCD